MDLNLIFTTLWPVILEWWPFIAVMFILWYVGQEIKKKIPPASTNWFWQWYWRTLSFHPLIIGLALGYFGLPVPATINAMGHGIPELYYCFAGMASVKWHDALRTWQKYKIKKEE